MGNNHRTIYNALWLTVLLSFILLSAACTTEDDVIVYKDSRRWVEKTVAVVAPLYDPIMKARLERTAEWMLDNLHHAQLHDTLCIALKLEWFDEYGNDLKTLGERLAGRDDVMAVIGPFDSDNVEQFAPYCQQTGKPLILPTATSESVIRRFAITTTGTGQQPFLWSLTETDISLSEVMLSLYASFIKQCPDYWVVDYAKHATLYSPDNRYGQTFFEWAPFQAEEMGISFSSSETYGADPDYLYSQLYYHFGELGCIPIYGNFIPTYIVAEDIDQVYQIARLRSRLWNLDPDDPTVDDDPRAVSRVEYMPIYYVLSNITDEGIAALGSRGVVLTDGYQGFSPYADPMTGFEMSYESRYNTKPTFAECKFYDALLLSAFAASYAEHHPSISTLNDAIIAICTTNNLLSGHAWSEAGMELYLTALEQGELMGFKGASGPVQFDKECYTAALNTTYVNWLIKKGHVYHQSYYSTQGNAQTAQTLASWNWLMQNAEERFDAAFGKVTAPIAYPDLTSQYAVLVQGSNGWQNYRHEADVLSIYQMLKANGYDDDHIILITSDHCANAPENTDKGAVRSTPNGTNLRQGAVVDYLNAHLTPQDIANILKGTPTETTPVVLPSDAGQNVLLFWSGHGRSEAVNGVNEMVWRDEPAGKGMTADLLSETFRTMAANKQFRQMLVCLEPCYSANMGEALDGIPGVLAICSAGAYEQSFADSWSNELGVWMCDRFSRNLIGHVTANPAGTYRDLYLYCAQHTLGSHVGIYNYTSFGNLYTTSPKDFFIKNQK